MEITASNTLTFCSCIAYMSRPLQVLQPYACAFKPTDKKKEEK